MAAIDQLTGRRILFLNWRDLANPASGGAEAYAERIARRLAAAGCHLTLFTSAYEDAPPYDWMDQYLVVRRGGRFGVYAAAARHLRRFGLTMTRWSIFRTASLSSRPGGHQQVHQCSASCITCTRTSSICISAGR